MLLLSACFSAFAATVGGDVSYSKAPFEMPVVKQPSIPDYDVDITDFGAMGDGVTLCTDAFRQAFEALEKKGGGRINVPQGVWLTGPIVFRSHCELHLETGAVILFSSDEKLFPLTETVFEGVKAMRRLSPLSGENLTDIAITGNGAIDGNGEFWRPLKRAKVTNGQWNAITANGGTVSKNGSLWTPPGDRATTRPNLLKFVSCKRVLLQGVTFKDSPAWNLHPLMCEDVILDHVIVRSPEYAQNSDALDLESCRNALIIGCIFDVGDDGICIKSGRDEEGRKRGMPTENVIVEDCTVFHGHGGFVVGSEMSGGARNIYVRNCKFLGTDNGLRFKSTRGRGGVVEKIYIENVSMTDISGDAILFNLYYASGIKRGDPVPEKAVDETTPSFRDIHISNVACAGSNHGIMINGLPEMPVKNIYLKDIRIIAHSESIFDYCKDIYQENVNVMVINAQ